RRPRRPPVVRRIPGQRHRHARPEDREDHRVESADALERALRRRRGQERRGVDRVDAHRPRVAPGHRQRNVYRGHATPPDPHPSRLAGRLEEAGDPVDRQQPRRVDREGGAARLMEYRSSASFLGLPLVHVATGALVDGRYRRGVATAWFAVGDIAIGVFFACGGVALGGISLGGAAFGLFPIGGFALGLLAVGGLGLGIVAGGGAAFSWGAPVGGAGGV